MYDKTTTEKLISEDFDIQPENRLFSSCDTLLQLNDKRIQGRYTQRINGCDLKLRFAAYAYEQIKRYSLEIEHGEFIYLDDKTRLMLSYHFESLVIFLRAALDMGISAYSIYFSGNTSLDSFSEFIKKVKSKQPWITSREYWEEMITRFENPTTHWTNWLIGKDSGVSVRDKSVHRGVIPINTYINDNYKGFITVDYDRHEMTYLLPICSELFYETHAVLQKIKCEIQSKTD